MSVIRQCKCCNNMMKVRQADINRGWGLFCSKSCKAIDQVRNKTKRSASSKKRIFDNTASIIKAVAKITDYNRIDLLEKLNRNMVYEWDNNIFEQALKMNDLDNAYKFIIQNS